MDSCIPNFVIASRAAAKQSIGMQRDRQPAVYIMASRRHGAISIRISSPERARVDRVVAALLAMTNLDMSSLTAK